MATALMVVKVIGSKVVVNCFVNGDVMYWCRDVHVRFSYITENHDNFPLATV